jgi:hypothetical protein
MTRTPGFAIVTPLNKWRASCFEAEHDRTKPFTDRATNWFAHKALSVVSLPANTLAAGIGCAGMLASACTLGAFKVLVFAGSLGHIKPEFSTGFIWCAERTYTSLANAVITVGELLYDVANLGYQAYLQVKWVFLALKLDRIAQLVKEALIFVGNRIEAGIEISLKDEEPYMDKDFQLPAPIHALNEATERRSCFTDTNQPLSNWFAHKLLSVVNIPLNAAIAVTSTALCIAGIVATCAKSLLYAATNIHVGIPTGVAYTGIMAAHSYTNVFRNTAEVGVDMAVMVYRIADLLRITRVIATIADVIAYVPRAVFS